MDSKGRATDNAITERFFRNLKQECLYLMDYSTVNELKVLVRNYVDWYNSERFHQGIDNLTPNRLYAFC